MDIKTYSDIKRYVYQVNSDKCVDTLNKHKDQIDNNFKKYINSRRNNECKNIVNMSDNPIGMYSPDQLIFYKENENIYCFTYGEVDVLLNRQVNPYTGEKLSNKLIKTLTDETKNTKYEIPIYPLDKAVNMYMESGTCFHIPNTSDDKIVYILSANEIKKIEDLPITIQKRGVNHHGFEWRIIGDFEYKPLMWDTKFTSEDFGVMFIYRAKIKRKFKSIFLNRKNISSITKEFSSKDIETIKRPKKLILIDDENIVYDLRQYMRKGGIMLPYKVDRISRLNIKEKVPIKVYRGLHFEDKSFVKPYKVGDTLVLYSRKMPTSWSTNFCVSDAYSYRGKYGMVVSTILNPEDIMIDTRLINRGQFVNIMFWRDMAEVITPPFDSNGNEKKFEVKIESFMYRENNKRNRVTDIKNFKYY